MRRTAARLVAGICVCFVVGVFYLAIELSENKQGDSPVLKADSLDDYVDVVKDIKTDPIAPPIPLLITLEEEAPIIRGKKQRPPGGIRRESGVNWTARCGADVFVVHWTHVPKAGGTAFANLAKKVACVKNPAIASINPCCLPDLCVAEGSCFSTASTCPFVQGIGRHTSNMGRLSASPCCSREWYLSTISSFLRYSLRPPPTDRELSILGLAYAKKENIDQPMFDVVSTRRGNKRSSSLISQSLAEVAGDGKRSQLVLRVRSYGSWPISTRLEFFAKTGVPVAELRSRLEKKVLGNLPKFQINAMLQAAERAAPSRDALIGILPKRNKNPNFRLPKPGEHTPAARTCARAAHVLESSSNHFFDQDIANACCLRDSDKIGKNNFNRKKGANSMTMIRNPFVRAVSAYFYRGHSPNYDNYNLRPGLWRQATDRDFMSKKRHVPLKEFFNADEYRNILTKMFGDSTECRQVQNCGIGINEGICAMVTGCHGYRNASDYLNESHSYSAISALRQHAFFGLLEAYNASVLLAYHTFGIEHPDDRDFAKSRASVSLDRKCSPPKVLRNDATACRAFYKAHALDFIVFEEAHRIFCHRLHRVGLLDDPIISAELRANRLCDSLNYAKADHACGLLETPQAIVQFKELRARCNGGPRWWLGEYGFYWKPDRTPTRHRPPPPPLPDVPLSSFLISTNLNDDSIPGASFTLALRSKTTFPL